MPSSDGYEAFVLAVLGKGVPFYGRCGLQWSAEPVGYPVWTTRSLTMVSPWGLGGVSAIAEAGRAASRRRMIVALKRMGSNDLKN
jgi:hypothetical protein